jgi:hypothetical protein
MKKILFVISQYTDYRQDIFNNIISPNNKKYCEKHNFKYVEIKNDKHIDLFRNNPTWWKFTIVRDLIDNNKVEDGDIISHIDADMYFVKDDVSLETTKSFSYSIDSGNTHCMGWYSIKINDWSKNLIKNILSEDRFKKLNDKVTIHDRFKTYSSFWYEFREQASWYSLAGIKRHSDKPFWEYPNNGFYSQYDENVVYSLDELEKNVEIFPTEFNVTEWENESSCQFNINHVRKDDVVIRHFAGGQDWNNVKNWIYNI